MDNSWVIYDNSRKKKRVREKGSHFGKKLYLCSRNVQNDNKIMEAIINRTPRTVTVRMSTRRWNRLQQMEQAYKLAQAIKRSMIQAEKAPSMTVDEAMEFIDKL